MSSDPAATPLRRPVVAVHAAQVVAVLVALILMYRPSANRFFGRALKESVL